MARGENPAAVKAEETETLEEDEQEEDVSDSEALLADAPNITQNGEISVSELLRWCSLTEAEQVVRPLAKVLDAQTKHFQLDLNPIFERSSITYFVQAKLEFEQAENRYLTCCAMVVAKKREQVSCIRQLVHILPPTQTYRTSLLAGQEFVKFMQSSNVGPLLMSGVTTSFARNARNRYCHIESALSILSGVIIRRNIVIYTTSL